MNKRGVYYPRYGHSSAEHALQKHGGAAAARRGWGDGVLEDVFALPAQLCSRKLDAIHQTPIFLLAFETFYDGIITFLKLKHLSSRSPVWQEANAWVRKDEPGNDFSFGRLCELFGIEAEPARRALIAKVEQPSSTPQPTLATRHTFAIKSTRVSGRMVGGHPGGNRST